jgi:hypothetical protein
MVVKSGGVETSSSNFGAINLLSIKDISIGESGNCSSSGIPISAPSSNPSGSSRFISSKSEGE